MTSAVGYIIAVGRWVGIGSLKLMLLAAGASVGVMWYLGAVIDGLTGGQLAETQAAAILYAVLLIAVSALETGAAVTALRWESRFLVSLHDRLGSVLGTPQAATALRSPRIAQRVRSLREAIDGWMVRESLGSLIVVLTLWLTAAGGLVIVGTWRWWVGPLIAGAFLWSAHLSARWSESVDDDLLEQTGTDRGKAAYLRAGRGGGAARRQRVGQVDVGEPDARAPAPHHGNGQRGRGSRHPA